MAQSLSMATSSLLIRPSQPSVAAARPGLAFSRRSSLRVSALKWEPSKVAPQGDRVLIRLEQIADKSAGGVLLPKSAVKFERYLMGEILSVGADVSAVQTGNKVMFSDISAYEVDLGTDDKHVFCKSEDLLAVIE